MDPATPLPTADEVRSVVLAEHDEIRPMLDEVEALADRFESGGSELGRTLRERGFYLYQRLGAHLELEERLLATLLRRAGARGAELADRLVREHAEQHELLGYLLERLGESTMPTLVIARELRSFVDYIRGDMAYEERTLLAEDVLHD